MHAIACAANASLSSIRSIWSIVSPARLSALCVAGIGPTPIQLGPPLALHGKRILLGTPDLVARGHDLGRLAQRDRPFLLETGIGETPAHRRVGDCGGFAAPGVA